MTVWSLVHWLENLTEVGRGIGLHVAGSSWFHASLAEGGHGFRWLQDRTLFGKRCNPETRIHLDYLNIQIMRCYCSSRFIHCFLLLIYFFIEWYHHSHRSFCGISLSKKYPNAFHFDCMHLSQHRPPKFTAFWDAFRGHGWRSTFWMPSPPSCFLDPSIWGSLMFVMQAFVFRPKQTQGLSWDDQAHWPLCSPSALQSWMGLP